MTESRQGFLGTLRSELDDSDERSDLDTAFETMAALCGAARAAYLEYRLPPEKAAGLFRMLRLAASDGSEWTVGPTSGAWYRRGSGEQEWKRAPLPIGVSPAPDKMPAWIAEGIGSYLMLNEVDATEEKGRSEEAYEESGLFEQGIINPFAGSSQPTGPAYVPERPEVGGEDADWLFSEWAEFDSELERLRAIRSGEGLPAEVPSGWSADADMAAAAVEAEEPRAREGADVEAEEWEPVDRGGLLNPESFFLPPEE